MYKNIYIHIYIFDCPDYNAAETDAVHVMFHSNQGEMKTSNRLLPAGFNAAHKSDLTVMIISSLLGK